MFWKARVKIKVKAFLSLRPKKGTSLKLGLAAPDIIREGVFIYRKKWIGHTVIVKYHELTAKGVPRFPVAVLPSGLG